MFFSTPNLKRRMKMPRIDKGLKELAFKMSEEGKTTKEISEATGIKMPTLYNMFRKGSSPAAPKTVSGSIGFSPDNPFLNKAREWETVKALINKIDSLSETSRQMVYEHLAKKQS